MSYDLRLPNITKGDPGQQIAELRSYLHQTVQELNYALNTIESSVGTIVAQEAAKSAAKVASSPEQAQATFSDIKALIIKSADIVNAYYEAMKVKYDGEYVAISDFGTFAENTSQEITENSTAIEQIFTNVQSIESLVSELNDTLIATNAWIRTGLLDYDSQSIPIYGMEVGQRTEVDGQEVFNKYARFTSQGIYFYLPGIAEAAAWMTGTKLYIRNAEITVSLTLGRYSVDFTNGLTFRWIGG